MSNPYFRFKQFTVHHDRCAMKVTTDACLFGAWTARQILSQQDDATRCLDIGAGTGLLSLMVAQQNEHLHIDAIEIDEAAAAQAKDNVSASPWQEHITVFHQDVRKYTAGKTACHDIVISNPPFYEQELPAPDIRKNIAHHSGGLQLKELLQLIRGSLTPAGTFYLLLPYKRLEEITRLIPASDLAISQALYVRHSAAHPYSRILLAGQHAAYSKAACIPSDLSIHDGENNYSATFRDLLSGYYLFL